MAEIIAFRRPENARILELEAQVAILTDKLAAFEGDACLDCPVHLTPTEERILRLLYRKGGSISADRIMTMLYADRELPPNTTIVRVTISNLRKKLAPYGVAILTRHWAGYEMSGIGRSIVKAWQDARRVA